MARTAIAVLQPVWDCRWSRPAGLSGRALPASSDTPWVCVREEQRRTVSEETCETCAYWEPRPTAAATINPTALEASAPPPATLTFEPTAADGIVRMSIRLLLALIAIGLFAIGLSILTNPLAVPVTVAFWLSAAAFVALAVLWRFPED